MNLQELISEYLRVCKLQNNLDKKTIKAYRADLRQYNEFMQGDKIFYDKNDLSQYVCFLNSRGYKVKTVKRKIASVKAFFSYLNYEDLIEFNPFHKMKIKLKVPLILPKTIDLFELNKLFQYMYKNKDKYDINSYKYKIILRDIIILELLISTGIRISELCSLKNEDVCNNNIRIYGKGAKERIIPLFDDNIWTLISIYKNIYSKRAGDYLFINKLGNQLSTQSVRNMLKKHSFGAGVIKHITPHMFRHTFATMLLEADVDSRQIQQLLGHSNIVTTQIYTHITSNKKSEIMRTKNPRKKIEIEFA